MTWRSEFGSMNIQTAKKAFFVVSFLGKCLETISKLFNTLLISGMFIIQMPQPTDLQSVYKENGVYSYSFFYQFFFVCLDDSSEFSTSSLRALFSQSSSKGASQHSQQVHCALFIPH